MTKVQTYADVEAALDTYLNSQRANLSRDVKIERTLELAELLGNPQNELRVVHVAGTSGKTSTSYYISSLLHVAGAKVGLTVSPHIDSIGERVQINGELLPEELFCRYFEEYLAIINNGTVTPTYFEFMMCFALWVFVKEGVDYAVVETGLGGLKDSSNICRRADKIGVITDIGYDHTEFLGNTLESIAENKAGITWPGNHILILRQAPEVVDTIKRVVEERGGSLTVYSDENSEQFLAAMADFQRRNWLLSYNVFQAIQQRDNLPSLSLEQRQNTMNVIVPGRMERWNVEGVEVLLDGAHNEQKMTALLNGLNKIGKQGKFIIVIGVKAGKDVAALAKLLAPKAEMVVASPFFQEQDLPVQSVDPNLVATEFRTVDVENVTVAKTSNEAIDIALDYAKEHNMPILVTGSFFMVAEAREHLRSWSTV